MIKYSVHTSSVTTSNDTKELGVGFTDCLWSVIAGGVLNTNHMRQTGSRLVTINLLFFQEDLKFLSIFILSLFTLFDISIIPSLSSFLNKYRTFCFKHLKAFNIFCHFIVVVTWWIIWYAWSSVSIGHV